MSFREFPPDPIRDWARRLWPRCGGGRAWFLPFSLLLCAGLAHAAEGAAGARSVTTAEFAAEIARLELRVQSLKSNPLAAQEIADSLPGEWTVGARQERISASSLRETAEAYARLPGGSAGLRANLNLQVRELADLAAELEKREAEGSLAEASQARPRLTRILARREFESALRRDQWELWKARLMYWLLKKLAALFGPMPIRGKTGNVIAWALILALTAWIASWLLRDLRRKKSAAQEGRPEAVAQASWPEWYGSALEAARAGKFRAAVHALYWSGITRLEDLQLLAHDRARTPRESLRQLTRVDTPPAGAAGELVLAPRPTAAQRKALESLTRTFELCWYGNRLTSGDEFQTALQQAEELGCRLP